MSTSPTQRTLAWLRNQGYTAAVTEHWNAHVRRRQDLFGIIDIIAVGDGETIGVQATSNSGSNVPSRVTKILESDNTAAWLKGGNRLLVVGWAKRGPRGKVKRWTPLIREIGIVGDALFAIDDAVLCSPVP